MAGKSSLSGWFASLPPVVRAALWMTFSAFSYAASIAIVHHLARDLLGQAVGGEGGVLHRGGVQPGVQEAAAFALSSPVT